MATLITTIEQVRAAGVRVNFTNGDSSLADMETAERRFLLPVLGQELHDILLAEVNEVNSDYAELIANCRRVIAPLAYWIDLATIQSQITDKGASTLQTTNSNPLHRWEYLELKEALADKGCEALEYLLLFLLINKDYYEWSLPVSYNSIFYTGKQFNEVFALYQPYRTFEMLRPVVMQVENQYISDRIGADFYHALRNNEDPTTEETTAIELIKNAVANLTIKTAIEVLPVKLSVNGFTVKLGDATDTIAVGEQTAADKQLGWMHKSCYATGMSYVTKLKEYLNKNASDTVFTDYFNSNYYVAPVDPSTIVNPNTGLGILGL